MLCPEKASSSPSPRHPDHKRGKGHRCRGQMRREVFQPGFGRRLEGHVPIKIGGVAVTPGEGTDTVSHFPLCFLRVTAPRVGIKVSFWEPVKLVEVVRHPGCFPSLGGRKLPLPSFAMAGAYGEGGGERGDRTSFLHVHHFLYPVFSVLNLFSSFRVHDQEGSILLTSRI